MIHTMTMTFYQALVDAQIPPASAHAVSEALRNDVQMLNAEHQKNLMTHADGKSIESKIDTKFAEIRTEISNVRTEIATRLNELTLKLFGLAIAAIAAFKLIPPLHS